MGTDHLLDYLQKKLFAFEQEQKRRQRQMERRKQAAKKLREKGGETTEDPDENTENQIKQEEENLSPEEKLQRHKIAAVASMFEIKKLVITLKRALAKSSELEHIIIVAKAIRELIPHMNKAREEMTPIAKPQAPSFFGNESKVVMLKKTTAVAIREVESVLEGIAVIINMNATEGEKMTTMKDVLQSTEKILKDMDSELPGELKDQV